MRPTHVLVATSDGEKLTGETWMALEDFAKLFTYGKTMTIDEATGMMGITQDVLVRQDERGQP